MFAVPPSLVKPYHSDSISVVANFAKLSHAEQSTLLGKRRRATFDYKTAIGKLYHLIGEEKPQFVRRIDPRDLFRVFVVEPRASFERLSTQSGAFFVSAFHERFEREMILRGNDAVPVYEQFTLTVPAAFKPRIMSELALLNVTRDALFPSLDEAARAITEHHRDLASPNPHEHQPPSNWTWHKMMGLFDLPKPKLPPDRLPRLLELGREFADSLKIPGDNPE